MKRISGLFLMKRKHGEGEEKRMGDSSTDLLARWRSEEEKRRKADAAEREKKMRIEEEESLQELRRMREEEKRRIAAVVVETDPAAVARAENAKKAIEGMYGIKQETATPQTQTSVESPNKQILTRSVGMDSSGEVSVPWGSSKVSLDTPCKYRVKVSGPSCCFSLFTYLSCYLLSVGVWVTILGEEIRRK